MNNHIFKLTGLSNRKKKQQKAAVQLKAVVLRELEPQPHFRFSILWWHSPCHRGVKTSFQSLWCRANCAKVWCFPTIRLSKGLCRVDSIGLWSEMKLILWTSKPVNRNTLTSDGASFSPLQLSQRFTLRAFDLCTDTSLARTKAAAENETRCWSSSEKEDAHTHTRTLSGRNVGNSWAHTSSSNV